MSDDDEKNTVVMSNLSKAVTQRKASTADIAIKYAIESETILNTFHINIAKDMAIAMLEQ